MSALGTILGYWFRIGPSSRTLHIARWTKTERGTLVIESACGAQVIDPRADEVPEGLNIARTPTEALAMAQPQQAASLCRRCRAAVMGS